MRLLLEEGEGRGGHCFDRASRSLDRVEPLSSRALGPTMCRGWGSLRPVVGLSRVARTIGVWGRRRGSNNLFYLAHQEQISKHDERRSDAGVPNTHGYRRRPHDALVRRAATTDASY
ncbi:hypothetical protein GW17_00024844 [Ensete ventricosum]|nr:hypothetical protein GW17_00024844 [Ensete ventricosum]